MTITREHSLINSQSVNLRKGLSAIASRQTGSFKSSTEVNASIAENIAAPKEISKLKCHAPSMLAL